MHPPITPTDLSTLIAEADAAARRLRRKLVLPAADNDDLRQDLLVDLICRLLGFDARRGSIGAFANIVLRNQSSRIAMRHHRQRRAQGGSLLSLEVPLAGTREPVGDTLTEDDGLAAWHGQTCCAALSPNFTTPCRPPSRGSQPRIAGSARRWPIAPSPRSRPRVSAAAPRSTAASPISVTSSPPTVSVPPGTISRRPE